MPDRPGAKADAGVEAVELWMCKYRGDPATDFNLQPPTSNLQPQANLSQESSERMVLVEFFRTKVSTTLAVGEAMELWICAGTCTDGRRTDPSQICSITKY